MEIDEERLKFLESCTSPIWHPDIHELCQLVRKLQKDLAASRLALEEMMQDASSTSKEYWLEKAALAAAEHYCSYSDEAMTVKMIVDEIRALKNKNG